MKTSYRLLILAALILFGTMTVYDLALKAEYQKGTYKNVLSNFSKLEYENFDVIQINGANRAGVEIQQSDTFNIMVRDRIKDYFSIKQVGSHLVIDLNLTDNRFNLGEKCLIIKCPDLKELRTDAVVLVNGKPVTTKDISNTTVFVKGFRQDNLKLVMNNASFVKLYNNQFKHLSADLGKDELSQSDLIIDNSNLISSADFNIQNKSRLTLKDVVVDNFKYSIADSAQLRLSGASLKLIKR